LVLDILIWSCLGYFKWKPKEKTGKETHTGQGGQYAEEPSPPKVSLTLGHLWSLEDQDSGPVAPHTLPASHRHRLFSHFLSHSTSPGHS
jgi:hypothetical protein